MNNKPFLKWAGGKFRVLDKLKPHFPPNAKRYIEPFLGAGAVALNVEYPEYFLTDVNSDLINVWNHLNISSIEFINECEKLFIKENNNEQKFIELRKEFNEIFYWAESKRKATLFVYLNRHCFNGLCRYNSENEFNVPFGKYDNPYFPRKEFENCLEKVKKFGILCRDFRKTFEMVKEGDLIYCDPPYLPVSTSANFSSYSAGGFNLQDQLDLAECARNAKEKGATVVITNHFNWYSKEIYKDAKISKIDVSRTISSKIDKRDKIEEIIAVFKN